ncbi:serine hydrolase [uncultured Sphingomonas sp.]|uniref:serine hydrolase n=1 Tax=uncultured Sphingomonas sp. TaxID=158754 RepID=UPI0025F10432|nr:serine hydrolase domain-containing protein [uncultured Sphingomonas sp.]
MLDGEAEPISSAVGYAKVGKVTATTETVFEAASLSKPVLAAAIHDLVRDGSIDLDEPVAKTSISRRMSRLGPRRLVTCCRIPVVCRIGGPRPAAIW